VALGVALRPLASLGRPTDKADPIGRMVIPRCPIDLDAAPICPIDPKGGLQSSRGLVAEKGDPAHG
jgi:hypothetical protein